jgi:hypothetical protein
MSHVGDPDAKADEALRRDADARRYRAHLLEQSSLRDANAEVASADKEA